MQRRYVLEIVQKVESQGGYWLIYLRPPDDPPTGNRPPWMVRDVSGGTLSMSITPDEAATVQVGDILTVDIGRI